MELELKGRVYDKVMMRKIRTFIDQESKIKNIKIPCYIIKHDSINKLRFDFITCIFVLFDCFFVPISSSFGLTIFDRRTLEVLEIIEYLSIAVFFIDILIGFCHAFINEKTGEQVTHPLLIAINYLKFYFWIDLLGFIPFSKITTNRTLH